MCGDLCAPRSRFNVVPRHVLHPTHKPASVIKRNFITTYKLYRFLPLASLQRPAELTPPIDESCPTTSPANEVEASDAPQDLFFVTFSTLLRWTCLQTVRAHTPRLFYGVSPHSSPMIRALSNGSSELSIDGGSVATHQLRGMSPLTL